MLVYIFAGIGALSIIGALIIGFGLKKIRPLVGGLLCGLAYFLISMCTVPILADVLRAVARFDETVALVTAIFTQGLIAAVISVICAIVIWGIRKIR